MFRGAASLPKSLLNIMAVGGSFEEVLMECFMLVITLSARNVCKYELCSDEEAVNASARSSMLVFQRVHRLFSCCRKSMKRKKRRKRRRRILTEWRGATLR